MKIVRDKLNQKGQTLIEIMIVVAIIAILAIIFVPKLSSNMDETRISKAKADMSMMRSEIVLYESETNNTCTDLGILLTPYTTTNGVVHDSPFAGNGWSSAADMKDPWRTPYQLDSVNRTITSYGKDKVPGGTGANADIIFPY